MSFQVDIRDIDTWKTEVIDTPGTLQVIDCYQDWCGPCKAIQASFKKLYFDMGDRPMKFYTANASKVPALEKFKGSCQPVFLFYKDGRCVETITGVQGPELTKLILSLSAPPAAA